MGFFYQQLGRHHVISLPDQVDAGCSLEFDAIVKRGVESSHGSLLFDCSELSYISSAGLGVFISYLRPLEERGGKMVLINLAPQIRTLFTLLSLEEVLLMANSLDEAIQICENHGTEA